MKGSLTIKDGFEETEEENFGGELTPFHDESGNFCEFWKLVKERLCTSASLGIDQVVKHVDFGRTIDKSIKKRIIFPLINSSSES